MLELLSNTRGRVIRIGLIICLSLVFSIWEGWSGPSEADAAVATLDAWPATPQLSATTGNPTGTFTISAGSNRLLVVAVGIVDSANTAWTVTGTYGGVALTEAVAPTAQRRTTWIGYLDETGVAGRSGDTLTVTISGTHTGAHVYIASYSGVDQTTPATGTSFYVNNTNNVAIGSLTAGTNDAGYRAYIWAGTTAVTWTSDTESFTANSNLTNQGTILTLGLASKAILSGATSNPTVTWSANGRTSTASIMINAASAAGPGTLQFSSSAYSVNENGGTVTITVTRTGGSVGAASVNYATSNGTATAGSDYTSTSGTLNWADGDSADKTFNVSITNDAVVEGNEDFNVTLSGASGASLGTPSSATVTIVDDDGVPPPSQVPAGNFILFVAVFLGILIYGIRKNQERKKQL